MWLFLFPFLYFSLSFLLDHFSSFGLHRSIPFISSLLSFFISITLSLFLTYLSVSLFHHLFICFVLSFSKTFFFLLRFFVFFLLCFTSRVLLSHVSFFLVSFFFFSYPSIHNNFYAICFLFSSPLSSFFILSLHVSLSFLLLLIFTPLHLYFSSFLRPLLFLFLANFISFLFYFCVSIYFWFYLFQSFCISL